MAAQRQVELLFVNDFLNYKAHGSSTSAVQDNTIKITNFVNQIYAKLNVGVTITLVAVHTFTGTVMGQLIVLPKLSL